ncbi:M23 family metallopeptidase [Streptomyces sp. ventii]|uniref:M23 family metallopeptidase n=2 Tax=Streptomyces spiramenti TaxID=2720606 RepID=A0ABX1ARC6_9ACTN|nr:M23 family metallopeptidase [Streptomyces spiramenti]NJP68875.1 M23 family metallopeptidase [Streptomyces spiramenti]
MVLTGTFDGPVALYLASVATLLAGLAAQWTLVRRQSPRKGEAAPEPVVLPAPFSGRWTALNSPATKVPSHTHSHAQTYAIDVLRSGPDAAPEPPFTWLWPPVRRPERYPSFGEPLSAPAAGTVVMAEDRCRDHLTRMSLPGLVLLVLEGFARSQGASRHLLGNHVTLDLGDGVYAVLAHLRRGSLRVGVGDRVAAGQQLGECGNSGNSSHPHLHYQLMDGPDVRTARGLPFAWRYRDVAGAERTGVPANTEEFTPEAPTDRPTDDPAG